MRVHSMLGRNPAHYIMLGFDECRNSFFGQVSELTLYGARDLLVWKGAEERVERVADLADLLAPYCDLTPDLVRALDHDREVATRAHGR